MGPWFCSKWNQSIPPIDRNSSYVPLSATGPCGIYLNVTTMTKGNETLENTLNPKPLTLVPKP